MTADLVSTVELGSRGRLLSIRSEAVGATSVRLLLPTGLDERPDETWPVLFLLHGMWDDCTSWARETDVEELTADLDLIVAMPDGGHYGWYTDWWNYGQGGRPMWETFHLTELRRLLEEAFRASDRRAVAGLSMGGFGAMHYAARHPGLFRAVASFSGVLDVAGAGSVPPPIDPQAFGDRHAQADLIAEHDPMSLAEDLRGLALYVSWGNGQPGPLDPPGTPFGEDEAWIGAGNERFVARLHDLGIAVTARGGPGTHTWPYWQRALHEAMPILLEALRD
jgi:S-formylglutathione hydrolase FrmB